ncbi:PIN domain-containing protein [Streptomyces sp. KR80]|uniref:PIN domain-containing protein n=1 Tax=Streptomyces sp. KR80 TaxID=3457426 RepID=UPI003FD57AC5
MIVLDTNQLKIATFPHGALLGMLVKIAALAEHDLAIPNMVAVEHVAHHQHEVDEAVDRALKELRTLSKAFDHDLTDKVRRLSGQAAAERRQAALEEKFTILYPPERAAEEALKREAHRRPPAKQDWKPGNARGARDVTIWLTLLEAARTANAEVWFLSRDNDFGNEQDFHPLLRQEAEQTLGVHAAARLRLLHGGINELLGELAEQVDVVGEDLEALLRGEIVAQAIRRHLEGVELDLFYRLLPEATASSAEAFAPGGAELQLMEVRRKDAYRVGDRIWVSAQLRWEVEKSYQHLQPLRTPSPAVFDFTAWTSKVTSRVEATVLLEIQDSTTPVSAEVTAMGPFERIAVSEEMDMS